MPACAQYAIPSLSCVGQELTIPLEVLSERHFPAVHWRPAKAMVAIGEIGKQCFQPGW